MKSLVVLVIALVGLSCGSGRPKVTVPAPTAVATEDPKTEPDPKAALAPPQPSLRLPRNFEPTAYAPRLVIDPSKSTFQGAISIQGSVSTLSSVIWLHAWRLEITKAIAKSDTVEVPLAATPKGEDLLELRASTPLAQGAW